MFLEVLKTGICLISCLRKNVSIVLHDTVVFFFLDNLKSKSSENYLFIMNEYLTSLCNFVTIEIHRKIVVFWSFNVANYIINFLISNQLALLGKIQHSRPIFHLFYTLLNWFAIILWGYLASIFITEIVLYFSFLIQSLTGFGIKLTVFSWNVLESTPPLPGPHQPPPTHLNSFIR